MLKWSLRIGLGLLALLILVLAVALFDFTRWRTELIRAIDDDPDRRIASTALGDIEYAVVGEGAPVLVLHGGPGGYDHSLIGRRLGRASMIPNSMTIAVSRPGSLGTPLSSGASESEQADLFVALLDELGVERVIVVATSAGGRPALQFVIRHPDRTAGVVLLSPAIEGLTGEPPELGAAGLFVADMTIWASAKFFPGALVGDYDPDNAAQASAARASLEVMIPMNRRWAGNLNDVAQSSISPIDEWPLESISRPVLIVHGDADTLTSYTASRQTAERIPNAQFETIEGGGHFLLSTRGGEVADLVAAFLESSALEISPSR